MTDNEGPAELASTRQNQRCAVTMENLPATGVAKDHQERPDSQMLKVCCEIRCFRYSGCGHIASQC